MAELPCPHCGRTIEIQASAQAELPLGPIGFSIKKVLDAPVAKFQPPDDSIRFDSVKPITENDSIRFDSVHASNEEDLIESVRSIIGEKEFQINGRLWQFYYRNCWKAIAYAVEDWKLRTPDQQRAIKNRPAWLTDRYKRAVAEIARSKYKVG